MNNYHVDSLNTESVNLFLLKALCILEGKKYSQLASWPFEDISIDDIFVQIRKICSSNLLIEEFVTFCIKHIKTKNKYSVIEGLLNYIRLFEELERYEDCIILKKLRDNILLNLQSIN
ncbi:MAG: hypothetical protein CMP49_06145 [Flavobacteriales bacterium]|nr:hypothetical protein [Flavobacteriales bacterium]|tara:strand:+ start:19634 stop:19987 length:354 start_codon:yes stop_codon:yes gene_type:complete